MWGYLIFGVQNLLMNGFNKLFHWYNGASAQCTKTVQNYLDDIFDICVLRWRGNIELPVKSPDLTVMTHENHKICQFENVHRIHIWRRCIKSDTKTKSYRIHLRMISKCINAKDSYFEHLRKVSRTYFNFLRYFMISFIV